MFEFGQSDFKSNRVASGTPVYTSLGNVHLQLEPHRWWGLSPFLQISSELCTPYLRLCCSYGDLSFDVWRCLGGPLNAG